MKFWLIVLTSYYHMHISFATMDDCQAARTIIRHEANFPVVCVPLTKDTMIQ